MLSPSISMAGAAMLLLSSARGHVVMNTPTPYNPAFQPIAGDTHPFPCHNQYDFTERTMMEAGSATLVDFTGGTQHDGGSCQFSITYDEPVNGGDWNKSAKFKTIYTIIGGCPAVSTDSAGAVMIPVPKFLKNGPATFAWTWFNKIGNKEMHMNCAPVNITGGTGNIAEIEGLPDIFVANYPNDPEVPNCVTGTHTDNVVVNIPNPGKYGRVLQVPSEPANKPSDYCSQIPPARSLPVFEADPALSVQGEPKSYTLPIEKSTATVARAQETTPDYFPPARETTDYFLPAADTTEYFPGAVETTDYFPPKAVATDYFPGTAKSSDTAEYFPGAKKSTSPHKQEYTPGYFPLRAESTDYFPPAAETTDYFPPKAVATDYFPGTASSSETANFIPGRAESTDTANYFPGRAESTGTANYFPGRAESTDTANYFPGRAESTGTANYFPGRAESTDTANYFPGRAESTDTANFFPGRAESTDTANFFPGKAEPTGTADYFPPAAESTDYFPPLSQSKAAHFFPGRVESTDTADYFPPAATTDYFPPAAESTKTPHHPPTARVSNVVSESQFIDLSSRMSAVFTTVTRSAIPSSGSNDKPKEIGDGSAVACKTHGALLCLNNGMFGLCNWGWAIPERLPAGTECLDGQITKREEPKKEKRQIFGFGGMYEWDNRHAGESGPLQLDDEGHVYVPDGGPLQTQ